VSTLFLILRQILTLARIIDAMIDDADRLPITHNALRLIFDQYKVSPRFENLLWWQHMPGRALHYGGEDGDEVLEHGEFPPKHSVFKLNHWLI